MNDVQGISFSLIIPAFVYIKPRVPISRVVRTKAIDTQFLRYTPFWILFFANALQGLGTFLPTLYLPSQLKCFLHFDSPDRVCLAFASDLNLDNGGTIALSLMNGKYVN